MGVVDVPPPPGRGVRGRHDGLLLKVLHVQITHNGGNPLQLHGSVGRTDLGTGSMYSSNTNRVESQHPWGPWGSYPSRSCPPRASCGSVEGLCQWERW